MVWKRSSRQYSLFCLFFVCTAITILLANSGPVWAAGCKVLSAHAPSEAEAAFIKADYEKATVALKADLAKSPNDPANTALLVRIFLRQQHVAEASDLLADALKAVPGSAPLITEQAELLYRQGKPWEVGAAVSSALKADPCYPRAYLIFARLMFAQSMVATARKSILVAHQLDPNEPEIRAAWMNTLDVPERILALEAEIASGAITNPDQLKTKQEYLDALKKRAAEPPRFCRLVSHESAAEIPLEDLLTQQRGGNLGAAAYGLQVKINGHQSLLELDTGASGLSITKAEAERAGLKFSEAVSVSGIGDEGPQKGHFAYADSIQIGGLQFKDCAVTVLERLARDRDGLIGADVFLSYLVTIDYPMHKLTLAQLPPRPDQPAAPVPGLSTSGAGASDERQPESPAKSDPAIKTSTQPRYYDRYLAPEMKDYLPIYRVGHDLITPAMLRKPDMKLFIIDTGAWATTVAPDAAREVTKVDVNMNMWITGISGKVERPYVAESLDLSFGGISKHLLGVPAISMDSLTRSTGMELAGFIGADILRELTIHIDYRDGLMKFDYDPKRGYHPTNH